MILATLIPGLKPGAMDRYLGGVEPFHPGLAGFPVTKQGTEREKIGSLAH